MRAMTDEPLLLDLFCGAGGASMGYSMAGFRPIGVDNDPVPLRCYPFTHLQGDWREHGERLLDAYDFAAIHASPPCQSYSVTKYSYDKEIPEGIVEDVREWLISTGLPYVIENVPGAPLINPAILDGTMFGLTAHDPATDLDLYLLRRRLFESNVLLLAPPSRVDEYEAAGLQCGGVYGGGSIDHSKAKNTRRGGYTPSLDVRRELMGIDWMPRRILNQAIPPAYSEWLGKQVLAHIERHAVLSA